MAKALVIAALGARGSGKSAWIKQQLQKAMPSRLVVWDPMREYAGVAGCRPFTDLGAAIRAMKAERWAIAYQPPTATNAGEYFAVLCKAVKHAKRCTFVVDELAFVTTASRAPAPWRDLCLLGRHDEIAIIGGSQRPASIDKDFLGCCDVLHCGRMGYQGDAVAVTPYLGCNHVELMQLPDLHYIEKAPNGAGLVRGVLSFGNSPQKKSAPRARATKAKSLRR